MDRLTAEEYAAWRQHPTTLKFRRYLGDWRNSLKDKWAAGNLMSPPDQAYAQILGDLEALEFNDIEAFYQAREETDEEQERDSAA